MKFKLEIECDNAAFDDGMIWEVSRILREVTERMADGQITKRESLPLFDVNGNRVGKAEFVK